MRVDILERDVSTMGSHDGPRDGQAESGATRFPVARDVQPLERSEDPFQIRMWNTGTVIGDFQLDRTVILKEAGRNRTTVFKRVIDDVGDSALDGTRPAMKDARS